MNSVITTTLVAVLIAATLTTATPTTPVDEHVKNWPKYHLLFHGDTFAQNPDQFKNASRYRIIPADNTTTNGDKMKGERSVATGRFNPALHTRGWHFLKIDTSDCEDATSFRGGLDDEYFRAGLLEGWLTYDAILAKKRVGTWDRTIASNGENFTTWVLEHIKHMETQAADAQKKPTTNHMTADEVKRWQRVGAIFQQMHGMKEGYNMRAHVVEKNPTTPLSFNDVFACNFAEEIYDVQEYFKVTSKKKKKSGNNGDDVDDASLPYKNLLSSAESDNNDNDDYDNYKKSLRGGRPPAHCSALVRVTDDDLYHSHDAWTNLQAMLRIYKIYQFSDVAVQMSSYSLRVDSLDDWYQTSLGLAAMETTLVVFNTSLYAALKPQCISEFVRVMVANYLSTTGKDWSENFLFQTSGTYNNEYIVSDFKKFTPGQKLSELPDGLLWVVDQVPGYGAEFTNDRTDILRTQGYFPSYNMPSDRSAFVILGYQTQVDAIGNIWSYDKYARAEIFKRNATTVHSLEHFQRLMRYDNFKHDPLSLIQNCSGTPGDKCTPPYSSELSIACRGDLNPPGGADKYGPGWGMLTLRDHAAIDAKIALWSSWKSGSSDTVVISGPTNDQQPTFQFTKSPWTKWHSAPPDGLPDIWNFPWVKVVAPFSSEGNEGNTDDSNATGVAVGVILACVAFVSVVALLWMSIGGGGAAASATTGDALSQPLNAVGGESDF